jgi:predicted MFS family arabinose efflux permease
MEDNTKAKAVLEHHKTIFDGWRSISIGLYMALAGYAVMVGMPALSAAWVELSGFTESQAGRVASADLGGFALGSIITAFLISRMNRRTLTFTGIILAIVGNVLCLYYVTYEEVLWLRIVAGTGSGICTAIALATLGGASHPARAFTMLLFAFAFTQGGEAQLLPMLSMSGIYYFFISISVIGLFFLHWIPPHASTDFSDVDVDVTDKEGTHHHIHKHVPSYVPWMSLAAIFLIYVSIGGYWTYIKLANLSTGMEGDAIDVAIAWASYVSVFGCLVTVYIANRYGMSRPLIIVLFCMVFVASMMVGDMTFLLLLLNIIMFNLLWVFIDVYQMGTMSNFDPTGKFVALIVAAQGFGNLIGPNIAASILDYNLGYDGVFIMCAIAAFLAMLVFGAMYVRLKKTIPALADAS